MLPICTWILDHPLGHDQPTRDHSPAKKNDSPSQSSYELPMTQVVNGFWSNQS